MKSIPNADRFTTAPLRHLIRLELHAALSDVWTLVGDHERLPEYSAGIERVDLTPEREARICRFRAMPGDTEGMTLREVIRWESPHEGYATSAAAGNPFGLENDLSIVTLDQEKGRTVFTWRQYYDHPDLAFMRANFDDGLADIAKNLVARFGGRMLEHYVDDPVAR
jgi:hypothetical protein